MRSAAVVSVAQPADGRRSGARGGIVQRTVFAALPLLLTVGTASGTERASQEDSVVRVAAPKAAYAFPSGRGQLQRWAMNTAGPSPIAGNLIGASWRQWAIDEPPEWSDDWKGFAKRFGAASLSTGITETSLSVASAVMRQDPAYYRSPRGGAGARLRHAAVMTVMAWNPRGEAVFSPAKAIAPFLGPIVTQATVYPDRYDLASGLTSGAYALLINAGWNLVREFVLPTAPGGKTEIATARCRERLDENEGVRRSSGLGRRPGEAPSSRTP